MASRSKSRDFKDTLTKSPRRRNRMPGELSYPAEHSKDQQALDNWNHMFLRSMSQGLTLRRYETRPSNILDLGCGSGLWVIEAAKQWPSSTFTGYDYLKIQPDLSVLCSSQPGLGNIADRIQWMHGNFLDALPFKSNSFDFVRICCIGLGVPEDEWQDLLQEVSRVLKPGAFVEIIEEDLIFPCGADSIKESDYRSSGRKSKVPGESSPKAISPVTRTISRTSNLTTKSTSSRLVSTISLFQGDLRKSTSPDTRSSSLFPRPTISELLDPRDHTKLKASWDRMLHKRFLAPGLLSVLQFYFSAEFEEIQSHPAIRIILPMNSQLTFDDADSSFSPVYQRSRGNSISSMLANFRGSATTTSTQTISLPTDIAIEGYGAKRVEGQGTATVVTLSWASMHLAKSFGTIQGCKEAIWSEYKDLDGPEVDEDKISDLRKEFLAAWTHWECDMKDRIGMRTHVQNTLAWSTSVPSDSPDWKAWRNRVGYLDGVDDADPYLRDTDICRAIRGFVGRKPFLRDIATFDST